MSGSGSDAAEVIEAALREDVGSGDRTTLWTVGDDVMATARIVAKAPGVLAGLNVAAEVFRRVESRIRVDARLADGDELTPGTLVMTLRGPARGILTAERAALNFLQRLSGIATLTRHYVDAVAGTGCRVLDTRKTTPGMRALEKRAVAAGGGHNHRFGLHDMVLIKENHIAAAGGIAAAVAAVRDRNDEGLLVEIEVRDLAELEQVLPLGVDRVLLDNMAIPDLRRAVERVRASGGSPPQTEASGGVTLDSVRDIADTGVDFVSVGALTHSASALDLSLLIDPA